MQIISQVNSHKPATSDQVVEHTAVEIVEIGSNYSTPPSTHTDRLDDLPACRICFEKLELDGSENRCVNLHIFHRACWGSWALACGSNSVQQQINVPCPLCRDISNIQNPAIVVSASQDPPDSPNQGASNRSNQCCDLGTYFDAAFGICCSAAVGGLYFLMQCLFDIGSAHRCDSDMKSVVLESILIGLFALLFFGACVFGTALPRFMRSR